MNYVVIFHQCSCTMLDLESSFNYFCLVFCLPLISLTADVCPSTECWQFDGEKCVLKSIDRRGGPKCGYVMACTSTAMVLIFDHTLFGTTAESNFANPAGVIDDSCDPVWFASINRWSWQNDLGNCGMIVSREK